MTRKYFDGLQSEYCRSIDHLYDLFFESKDLAFFLAAGLEWITTCLNRPGGALYNIYPYTELTSEWIKFNIPEIWEEQLINPQSRLVSDAFHVYKTQTSLGENAVLQISAMLPMSSHGKTLGVLILRGNPLNQEESDFADILVFVFTRVLLSQSHASTLWAEERENKILQTVESSLQVIITDPNQALLNLVKGIRKSYNAEYLLFLQKDPETPELIFKKLLADGDEWVSQTNQRVSPEYLQYVFQIQNPDCVRTLPNNNELIAEILELEGSKINSIIYSPIISTAGEQRGFLLLINSKYRFGSLGKEYLRHSSNVLADILDNINSIQKNRINLAKMEVRQVELKNSRNNLRTMFDNIPLSIYIVDSAYKILIINIDRSERLCNKPYNLVGKTCYEALYNRTTPCTACRIEETLREGKNTTRIWREWTSSETYIEWEIYTHPIFDENHVPIQAIIREVDITEKRNLEANLIQSEKLAAVGQLAAGVAHEINNPLSAIIANAQILLQEVSKDNEDEVESLKLIETAGIRASQVVRNLLSISRKEHLEFELTSINESIRNALLLIQHELLKRPITVKMELSDNMPFILAQQDHLQGVWINLLMNAIDAITATNRPDGLLTIKTSFTSSEIHINIFDNGKGIEPEKMQKIFEPFYTTKAVGHGTGLGLSVCMRVIKEHQGTLSVDSQPNQGTHFSIALPISDENILD